MTSGVAMGRSIVPTSRPIPGMPVAPTNCASSGRFANGRFQLSAFLKAAMRLSDVSGKSMCTRAA